MRRLEAKHKLIEELPHLKELEGEEITQLDYDLSKLFFKKLDENFNNVNEYDRPMTAPNNKQYNISKEKHGFVNKLIKNIDT